MGFTICYVGLSNPAHLGGFPGTARDLLHLRLRARFAKQIEVSKSRQVWRSRPAIIYLQKNSEVQSTGIYNSFKLLFIARIFVRAVFGMAGQHAFLEFLSIADLRLMT